MSINKRIAFGAAASWFSRGVTILMGLVLMPVLFRHLPKEELGVWLLLGQSWVALGVFEYGIQMAFTRKFAFVVGKAGGFNVQIQGDSAREMADLIAVTKHIYHWLTFIIFFITWLSGLFYLSHVHAPETGFHSIFIAWTILCVGNAINVWSNPWSCLLQGIGYVGWDSIIGSIGQVVTLALQISVVLLGYGVASLAAVTCISGLLQRFLLRRLIRRRRPELFAHVGQWNSKIFHEVLRPAIRATLTSLAGTLLTNTDQLFIGYAADITELPAFRAAFLLAVNAQMLAVTLGGVSTVFVSQLWQAGKIDEMHHVVLRNLRLGLVLFGGMAACFLAVGREAVGIWLGPGNFIGYSIFGVFLLSQALETNSYIISSASRATNDEAFVWSTVISGLLKVCLAFTLIHSYGLLGLALSTPVAQLLTNHWFMVFRGLRRLQISILTYATGVLLPVLAGFVILFGLLTSVSRAMQHMNHIPMVASTVTIGVVGCLIAIVFFVFNAEERTKMIAMILRRRAA